VFDIGFWEIAIIVLIALIVLGPERLPRAARTIGFWVGKARRTLAEVKRDIDREIDAADLKELKDIKEDLQETKTAVQDVAKTMNESAVSEGEFSIMPDSKAKEESAKEEAAPKEEKASGKPAESHQARPQQGLESKSEQQPVTANSKAAT